MGEDLLAGVREYREPPWLRAELDRRRRVAEVKAAIDMVRAGGCLVGEPRITSGMPALTRERARQILDGPRPPELVLPAGAAPATF